MISGGPIADLPIGGIAESAPTEVNGSLAATIAAFTLSASAKLPINASAAQTIAAVSLSASGKLLIAGSLNSTIAAFTLTATAKLPIVANAAQTIDPVSLTASAGSSINASFGQTIGPVSLSATGRLAIGASAAQEIGPVTLDAWGQLGPLPQLDLDGHDGVSRDERDHEHRQRRLDRRRAVEDAVRRVRHPEPDIEPEAIPEPPVAVRRPQLTILPNADALLALLEMQGLLSGMGQDLTGRELEAEDDDAIALLLAA